MNKIVLDGITLVAGPRYYPITKEDRVKKEVKDYVLVKSVLDRYQISYLISGGAKGIDTLAEKYANENKIEFTVYDADWTLGKQAGFIRNHEMLWVATNIIVFWDKVSTGSKHMIEIAKNSGKPTRVIIFEKDIIKQVIKHNVR